MDLLFAWIHSKKIKSLQNLKPWTIEKKIHCNEIIPLERRGLFLLISLFCVFWVLLLRLLQYARVIDGLFLEVIHTWIPAFLNGNKNPISCVLRYAQTASPSNVNQLLSVNDLYQVLPGLDFVSGGHAGNRIQVLYVIA